MSAVDVSVVSCAHDVADARLHRICAALRRSGLTVEVIGLGDPAGGPADVALRSLGADRSRLRRVRNALTLPFRARGEVLVTLDPDLVPPALLWRTAGRLRRAERAVVVDVHEDYLSLLRDRAWARSAKGVAAGGVARAATVLAERADLTAVADEHVPPLTARHRLVVRNLPDLTAIPASGEPEPEPRALYIGDVRRSRGLQAMIEAVLATPPWRLDIVGPVAAADAAWLEANPPGDRVTLHGRLPLDRAWALARGAWAGLCLLDDTPAFRAAVPTKLYEYLGSGLAVLATPLPRMAAMVAESGAGSVVQGPQQASSTLSRWYSEPAELRRHREAARRWAERTLAGPSPFDELAREVRALVGASALRRIDN